MYAILKSGGKQYRVAAGDTFEIERIKVPEGETVELDGVLMIVDNDQVKVGSPTIENATVVGHVIGDTKGKKVTIFKFKKRKNVRRKTGHRQKYIKIQVDEIRPGI